MVAGALLLSACGDGRPPAARVEGFCAGIRQGEPIRDVLARYEEFDLQPGGFAPDPSERLGSVVDEKARPTLSGVLAEPTGSPPDRRPVCAIYYSERKKGGDDRVILAEFKADWPHRY